jgi:Interferon-induced transmembrane protein
MADETGPQRSKYPPPKPPTPTTAYQPSPPQPQAPPPQPQPQPQQAYQPQPQPGYRPDVARQAVQPPARWALSIISFLCFFLIGIVAIYFSAQVGTRWRTGNTAGAEKASQAALLWGIAGIILGLIVFFAAIGSESGTGY